ncbi:hypothetical protein ES707_20133 [subsurface metagenome]
MKILEVPIAKIKNWKHNPRSIHEKDFKRLQKQLKEYKQFKPLICYKQNGSYITLGGNMRLRAMQKLGFQKVSIVEVEAKTKKERIKLSLIDNDRSGYYDDQALAELIYPFKDELDLGNFKVDLKIPDMDLGNVLDRYAPSNEKDDEIPVVKKTKIKLGDLFQLGRHRLLCGDATKKEDVERLMDGKKADMVFTDPPYNIDFSYEDYRDTKTTREYLKFCKKWFDIIQGIHKIIITPGPRNLFIWHQIKKPIDIGCWIKANSRSGASVFHFRLAEPILFYGEFYNKRNTDVFEYSRAIDSVKTESEEKAGVENVAPAKPVKFIKDIILSYSQRNDKILDIFGGSGSTLLACEDTERNCEILEINPIYCQVIINRFENYTNQKAVKIG